MSAAGANKHIAELERRIRVIEVRCRGTVNKFPNNLCKKLLEYLLHFSRKDY